MVERSRAKTKIIPVITMPSPCIYDWTGTWADSEKWTGHITKIEATGTPKNALLGGDDCATGMMGRALRESVQI